MIKSISISIFLIMSIKLHYCGVAFFSVVLGFFLHFDKITVL